MIKHFCDRCEKEVSDGCYRLLHIEVRKPFLTREFAMELCDECLSEMFPQIAFFAKEKETEIAQKKSRGTESRGEEG